MHANNKQKAQKSVRAISVTGGKGGVGKTLIAVNLSIELAKSGQKVILLDADFGLGNVDVALGLDAKMNISDVLQGKCELKDILIEGPGGISIVPATSGNRKMTNLAAGENAGIISAFSDIAGDTDVLIVDTAAGISENVANFTKACQEIIIVVCNEPTSITDAYALIKSLHQEDNLFRFHVIANMVDDQEEGKRLFAKLTKVTERFLDVHLDFIGAIPTDEYVRKSIKRRQALVECFPGCKAAKMFKTFAGEVNKWPATNAASGHIEFFLEQLVYCRSDQYGTGT